MAAERSAAASCARNAGGKKMNKKQASRRQQLPVIATTWEMKVCSEGFGKPKAS
jgi:hypothetical protein